MEQLGREEIVLEAVHLDGRQVDYSATAEALLAIDPPVDAVQAFSDELAMQLLAALYRRGVGVPDPLAIVGFDDRRAAQWAAPPLTTVAQPSWQVGQAAGEIILRKIAGEATPPGGWSRWLPTRLVRRVSA
jgi:DNA-binding LacI/PurR family transcriptional regulator